MITSAKNPHIQHIRKLQSKPRNRRKEAAYVVEGVRLVGEALTTGLQPELVIFTQEINFLGQQIVDRFLEQGIETLTVSSEVMQMASDTQTPQGILAVLPIPIWQLPKELNFLLILDGVRDPGNLGTLLRTALAAGVQAVILPVGSVDAFSPKVVRAGMGAHFRLPILNLGWETIDPHLHGLNIFLADSVGGQPYFETNFLSPFALVIGGEATGAGNQAAQRLTKRVHIPMPGKSESLNAAIAGGILMFEAARQRG